MMVKSKMLSLLTLNRWVRRSGYTTRREQTIENLKEEGINRTATHIGAHNVAERFFAHLFGIIIPQINYVLGLNIAFQLVDYCPVTVTGDEALSCDNSSEQSDEESSITGNTIEHENGSEDIASSVVKNTNANSSGNDGHDGRGVALRPFKRMRRIENDGEVDRRTPVSMEGDGMQIVSPTHLGISRRFLTAFPY